MADLTDGFWDTMDSETRDLVFRLQMSDLGAEAGSMDEYARQTYANEMQQAQAYYADRDVARHLNEAATSETGSSENSDDVQVTEHSDYETEPEDIELLKCVSCLSGYPARSTTRAPCSDVYCAECITQLFETAMVDESLFPPRCCRIEIPLEGEVSTLLGPVLTVKFANKSIEFNTIDKTYCSAPQCAEFIPPNNIHDDKVTCGVCQAMTCTICKGPDHEEGHCSKDQATGQVLDLAREQGWQSCNHCRRVIELNTGCNHMT